MKIEMMPFKAYVEMVRWNLRAHPELWNEHTSRTDSQQSPHHGLDDIWCRFGADPTSSGEQESVWYPSAQILGVQDICEDIMQTVRGKELGGVLITRIPPGKECKPHTDQGWHARKYEKFGVQIESAPGQSFCFNDESLESKPGDVFWFDNQYTHWVPNPTEYERVTMIVCIKR